jgi:signal transduction histidine kinase
MGPLLVYGFAIFFLSQEIFERDQSTRNELEVSSALNTWEKLQKKVHKQISEWVRQESLASKNFFSVAAFKKSLQDLPLEPLISEVQFYSRVGDFVGSTKNTNSGREVWKNMIEATEVRRQVKPKTLERAREPSSLNLGETEILSQGIQKAFRDSPPSLDNHFKSASLRENVFSHIILYPDKLGSGSSATLKPDIRWYVGFSIRDYRSKVVGFGLAKLNFSSEVFQDFSQRLDRDLVLLSVGSKVLHRFEHTTTGDDVGASNEMPSFELGDFYSLQKNTVQKKYDLEPVSLGLLIPSVSFEFFKQNMIRSSAILGVILFVLILFASLKLSKIFSKPLRELVEATETMARGEQVMPVEAAATREIIQLVEGFNQMASTVQASKKELQTSLKNLEAAQDQLIQSEKLSSLGQLVAGVAHELNNPIAFIYSNMTQLREYSEKILMVSQLIDELVSHLPENQKNETRQKLKDWDWHYIVKDIQEIAKSGSEGSTRVKDIVNGLRNFSRTSRDATGVFELESLIQDTLKIVKGISPKSLHFYFESEGSFEIEGHRSQIGQVILNMLVNSMHAVKRDGIVKVRLYAYEKSQFDADFVIEISDNGSGIPPENLKRIFDPFFTTKKVGEGTGLGLSIAYGIVKNHGGDIRVESSTQDPGRGTVFQIFLKKKGMSGSLAEAPITRFKSTG